MKTTYQIDFDKELKKCVKCGTCRAHCPLFTEIKGEPGSPRGRLALVGRLQQGKIEPSEELEQILYTCLLCKTCAVNCPSGVISDELFMAVRDYLDHHMNKKFTKKAILRGFLTRPGLLYAAMSMASLYQKTGMRSLLNKTKLIELLPEEIQSANKIMPDVTKTPARSSVREVTPAVGQKRFKVAYFIGCATNLIYPEVSMAGIDVLSENGCEVIVLQDVKCCGMPHMAYGDTETAADLARNNMTALLRGKYDAIICDCASCASTLIEAYSHLFEEGKKEYAMAQELREKTWEICKFLVEKTGIKAGSNRVEARVTYHDPCHLKRGLKIFNQPRKVLQSIPGIEFSEMKEADRCCGSAGSFSIMHFDLSMKVLDKKIKNIQVLDPDFLATSCPTCTMQLSYGLKQAGLKAKLVHPVQLLAESYK